MIFFKITKKIINFLFFKGYGVKNYPKEFKYIIGYCKKKLSENQNFKIYKNLNQQKQIVKLASKKIKLNINNFDFNFSDNEDKGYLHRWSWFLNQKNNKLEKKFIESFINNWIYKYGFRTFNIRNIEWYPYNISERLANYAIFCEYKIIDKNSEILKILSKQLYFLTLNIEIYKDKMSNHALNNARAIFLFSCILNDTHLQSFSRKLILYLCERYIDKNGFFRFGSSHYQFIFTRWILEIYYFMSIYDNKNSILIKKYLNKTINACNFFLIKSGKNYSFPFFGNLSPDYTPDFSIYYIQDYLKKEKKKSISSKEWIKFQNKNQTIFFRNPMINKFDFNHAHSDFFHFVNYYKGIPIFTDLGRKNYQSLNKKYILGMSHNSILINGRGIYDDFIDNNILNRLGFKQLNKETYYFKKNKNKIKFISKITNKYLIKRIFEIKLDKFYIKDFISSKNEIGKIEIPFFIDQNIQITKIDYKNYFLKSKNIKAKLSIKSREKNISIKLDSSDKLGLAQCVSYGSEQKNKFLKIECFSKKSFNSCIKIEYLK